MPHLPHVRVTREPYPPADPEGEGVPSGANLLGVGLVIAAALAGAVVLVVGALVLAVYVVVNTI
jgi:hypothetical protein